MRTLRLASLLLLGLAACTVDTDSLKPKSNAECAALDLKACGNRCMPITVANGCGNPGCTPCPAVRAGEEAFCDGSIPSVCSSRPTCPTGSAYCDGPTDTTCDDLVASPGNCGACGHYCGATTCANSQCTPTTVLAASLNPPLDVAYDGASLYWPVLNVPAAGSVSLYKDGASVLSWPGRQNRVEADGSGVVLWSTQPGEAIYEVRAGDTAPTRLFSPASAVRSLAIDPRWAYFSETGSTALHQSAVDLVEVARPPNADPARAVPWWTFTGDGGLSAVAIEQPASNASRAIVGTDSGALRWAAWDLNSGGSYATGVEPPVALVVYNGLVGPGATVVKAVAFWVSVAGNLYGKVLPDGAVVRLTPSTWTYPSNAGPGGLDLYADAGGVYWVDSGFQGQNYGIPGTFGLVGEWRAAFDDVVVLHLTPTGRPSRVTATSDHVVWVDAATGAVLSVAK